MVVLGSMCIYLCTTCYMCIHAYASHVFVMYICVSVCTAHTYSTFLVYMHTLHTYIYRTNYNPFHHMTDTTVHHCCLQLNYRLLLPTKKQTSLYIHHYLQSSSFSYPIHLITIHHSPQLSPLTSASIVTQWATHYHSCYTHTHTLLQLYSYLSHTTQCHRSLLLHV